MAVDTISASGGSSSRSGNNVTLSFNYSSQSKNGAYRHQIRVNGSTVKTSGTYPSTTSGSYSTTVNNVPGSGNRTFTVALYIQWQQSGAFQEYTSTTITVSYTAATYTVTFNAGTGGTSSQQSKSVTYGGTYGTLPTATKSGANFTGWYDAETGGGLIESTSTVTKTSNHALYAYYDYVEEGVVSKIRMLSGTVYDIKDADARASIASLNTLIDNPTYFVGYTSTALSDGADTNPINIEGNSVTVASGAVALYGDKEFIFSGTDDKWHAFGDWGDIGDLAYKAVAEGSITPSGTVTTPTFTGTEDDIVTSVTIAGNVTISTGTGTANYTPAGTVGTPTITVTPSTEKIYGLSSAGSQDSLTTTVSGETMTLAFTAGSAPTRTSQQTVMKGISSASSTKPSWTGTGVDLEASFSGTQVSGSATYTPAGTITKPNFTGTQVTITVS